MTDTEPDTDTPVDDDPRPTPTADLSLMDAPFTFRTLRAIADTEFVPAGLRGNVDALLACILTGRELGLGPMESMRSIDVIDGKPSPSGEWMLSRVYEAGHIVYTASQSDTECTVVGQRREHGTVVAESEFAFTWDMATRAGLTNKSNWKRYPEAMLYWRAVSQLCRQLFPDVLHGIKYVPDELGDTEWHQPIPAEHSRGTITIGDTTLPHDAPTSDIHDAIVDARLTDTDDDDRDDGLCPECDGAGGFINASDNADIDICAYCNGSGHDPERPFEPEGAQ